MLAKKKPAAGRPGAGQKFDADGYEKNTAFDPACQDYCQVEAFALYRFFMLPGRADDASGNTGSRKISEFGD